MPKRRMCVSIKKELYSVADEVTVKYGPALFVGACLELYAKKDPVFLKMIIDCIGKNKAI